MTADAAERVVVVWRSFGPVVAVEGIVVVWAGIDVVETYVDIVLVGKTVDIVTPAPEVADRSCGSRWCFPVIKKMTPTRTRMPARALALVIVVRRLWLGSTGGMIGEASSMSSLRGTADIGGTPNRTVDDSIFAARPTTAIA